MSRNNGYSSIGESPESIASSSPSPSDPSLSTGYYQQTAASVPSDAYAMDVEDLLYTEDSLCAKNRSNKANK